MSTAPQTWSVEFALTDAQARALADPLRPVHIAGGCAPWTGSQRFDLTVEGPKAPAHVTIEANVRTIAPVAVALHALARGAVIREGDVELKQLAGTAQGSTEKIAGALHAVEDAIGHELVRPVSAGSPVSTDCLRAPWPFITAMSSPFMPRAGRFASAPTPEHATKAAWANWWRSSRS